MKTRIPLCLAILTMAWLYLPAQNPFWTFPEKAIVPDGIITLPTDDYNGQEADYVHGGLMDPFGEIMFFALDGKLYDKYGEERSEFDNGGSFLIEGGSELLVVPQPGSCNRYYIFQTENQNGANSEFPHYAVYDDTLGGLVEFPIFGEYRTSLNLVEDPIFNGNPALEDWDDPLDPIDHGVHGVHYAATKQRPGIGGRRWVFISNNNDVYRLDLSCQGMIDPNWKFDLLPGNNSFVENGWRSEMELFEDTANNRYRIATPHFDSNTTPSAPGKINVAVFDVNYTTGAVDPSSRFNINIEDVTSGVFSYVHGLEFSPNGELLYIVHDPTPNYPSPLSYYNFATSTLHNLNYPNTADFAHSQIQVGGSPGNYSLYFASDDYLGRLSDPNNPLVGNWDPTAIPFNSGYSTNYGGSPIWQDRDQKHIIPDQIDYMDYDSIFVKASCDCCHKYAYTKANQDTSKTISTSTTWSPGIGNNPWNALASDTIFIRDSLLVRRGTNLTIRDLNFRFGRDGVLIVQRGDATTNGAVLNLRDAAHLTADMRCAKLDFPCVDPTSEECKSTFWQGIRVEGNPSVSQSLSGSTVQARLNIEGGCTIEYAQVGILAGHEQFSGYGGGMVRIQDSYIKDCPVSLRFHKYVTSNGSGEIYNVAKVQNMNFFWTSDLLTFKKFPLYHVDIIESSGINLRGNIYENRNGSSFSPLSRGTGIHSFNSRVSDRWLCNEPPPLPVNCGNVVRSQFLNMDFGFRATSTGSSRTIEAGYGIYENNRIGIYAIGLVNPKLLDNDFKVPNITERSGITLTSSTGYVVEGNSFTSVALSPVANNIGIYVQSSGTAMNEIYRNTFKNIAIGIASIGINADCADVYQTGLRWKCNTFNTAIPFADIYVHSGNVSNEQGECSPPAEPAGNLFSHTNNGYDIKVRTAELSLCGGVFFDIEYNYHDVTGGSALVQRLQPLTYTSSPSHVDPYMCAGNSPDLGDCSVKQTAAPPGKTDFEELGGAKSNNGKEEILDFQYFEETIADFYTSHGEFLSQHEENDQLDEDAFAMLDELKIMEFDLWKQFISAAQWDTLGDFDHNAVLELINQYQPATGGARFASMLSEETDQESPNWIDSEDNVTEVVDENPLSVLGEDLPATIDELIEESYFNAAANTAAILELYEANESYFLPYGMELFNELPDSFESEDLKSAHNNVESHKVVQIKPNPFNEYVFISWDNTLVFESSQIVVHDILGREVLTQTAGKEYFQILDGAQFQEGIFIYSLFLDGQLIESGRMIKTY